MQSRSRFVRGVLIAVLIAASFPSLGEAQDFPTNLISDIAWSPGNFSTVADIQTAFNNARHGENTQLTLSLPDMTIPFNDAQWNAMSNSSRAAWLINSERSARGIATSLSYAVDLNVIDVAQGHANFLLTTNQFCHVCTDPADGSPSSRLTANFAIGGSNPPGPGHQQSLGVSENISWSGTSGSSIALPVESAVYGWIYEDLSSNWGHRHALLWKTFTDDYGDNLSEGRMGIGRASGGPYTDRTDPGNTAWPFAEIIVFNIFDPDPSYNSALPVQLNSFTANATAEHHIRLRWTTVSEVNNYGYYVQRRASSQSQFVDLPGSFVSGHGTTNVPQQYEFTDSAPLMTTGLYRLRQVDLDGSAHYSDEISVNTLTGVAERTPVGYSLKQNYPNPFNPTTSISYSLPVDANVSLEVFNVLGSRVAEVVSGRMQAGAHTAVFDATTLSSGVYYYRLRAGDYVATKNLVLMR